MKLCPHWLLGSFGAGAFWGGFVGLVVLFVLLFRVASPTNMQSFQSFYDDLGAPPTWRPYSWKKNRGKNTANWGQGWNRNCGQVGTGNWGRGLGTGNWGQGTGTGNWGRRQQTEDRELGQGTGQETDRELKNGNLRQGTGAGTWRWGTGGRELGQGTGTGNWGRQTGDRTWDRELGTRIWGQGTGLCVLESVFCCWRRWNHGPEVAEC